MIITRIPPSPTGHLHIGTVRTALFNYLFAKHNGGQMLFRSEDTDKERSTKEFENEIINGLQSLGITWDNKEIVRQSERTAIYRKYLEQGIKQEVFYVSKEPSKQNPDQTVEVVRLKNLNKVVTFNDLIRGDISFDTTELGDIVIARSIDDALYHFAVVVDDYEMGVTHILRGEDHISNTPRQILIQEALGFSRPTYGHLPLILAPDRSKMSKRHGAVAVKEYLDEGFLPEAIINYLALLGWNPGTEQEIFSLEELTSQFSVEHIHKGGAVFDKKKFLWINKEHLNRLSPEVYFDRLKNSLPKELTEASYFDEERLKKLMPTIRERVETLGQASEAARAGEYDFAFVDPEVSVEMLPWKKDKDISVVKPRLLKLVELLETADFSSVESIKSAIAEYVEQEGKGEVLWPMRVALTGLEKSPDPFTVAYIIGPVDTLKRLKACYGKINE